jgi:hypothetical protein
LFSGVVRSEAFHSDLLAFFLDPHQNHGLGDLFARRFRQRILREHRDPAVPVTAIDLEVWRLNELTVRREWQAIDIMLTDDHHQLAVIIENKVAAEEQRDQLSRYAAIVRAMYPGWDRIFAVFLTPSGRPSTTSGSNPYFPVSYALVADVIDELLAAPSVSIAADVRVMLAAATAEAYRVRCPDRGALSADLPGAPEGAGPYLRISRVRAARAERAPA